jgi:hypothetical protein
MVLAVSTFSLCPVPLTEPQLTRLSGIFPYMNHVRD